MRLLQSVHRTTHRWSNLMHEHDLGLAHDLAVIQRRRALLGLAGVGTLIVLGCGGGGGDEATTTTTTTPTTGSGSGSCSVIPEETAGPYPGDGSNGANALALSGIVRSDIRSSISGASGVAGGVPLELTIELVNTNSACADLAGYAIYLWHCDREGRYSMYSSGVTAENYLRGVQVTGSDGKAAFTTIVPGCYAGRMPHMHFEVYRDANTASSWTNKLKTSQIAFPTDIMSTVYNGADGYSASVSNLSRISFASDNVFSDGVTTQLATISGSIAAGYTASLIVGIGV
jgi:protocatechuate 3,4-dioxygenase beta subunit